MPPILHQHDQWLVDGSPDFGLIPGGLLAACPQPAPIHLFRGNRAWGWDHIGFKHGSWVYKYQQTVEEMVWLKCGQSGNIHQPADLTRLTLALAVAPKSFIVVTYLPHLNCYSITTLFNRVWAIKEPIIGLYAGARRSAARPIFAVLPYISN